MRLQQQSVRFIWMIPVLVLAAGSMACAALQGTQVAPTEVAPRTETISVTGFGEATGTPDIATIQLGVEVEAESIPEAIEASNQTVAAVQEALIAMGIPAEDLQSTNFNVWREEVFDPLTGQNTGEIFYHVDSTLRVTVRDIDRISEAIQTGLDAGANNVFGLTFGIDDTAGLEAEARQAALTDAQDRAEQLASGLGVQLGPPVLVSELAGGATPFNLEAAFGIGMGGGGGPPLSPGELTVQVQVDMAYAVER